MTTLADIFIRLIGSLPLPVIRILGALLGFVLAKLPTRLKQTTELQLARCLPEMPAEDRARIADDSLVASAHAIVEAPAIWFGPISRRQRWIANSDEPLNTIRQAHAAGSGVILLTPHQGAWELASFFCAQVAPLTVLYKPQKGLADRLILEGRTRGAPVTPVPTTSRGVKALLTALRAGEMVGILPDHDPPDATGTVFAPLFGIPANTMDLVTKLAARTGAPVLYVVAERLPWIRGYRFHVLKAPPAIADPVQGPTALNAGIEHCIRMLPGQYWWSYRRFRRRPPGAPAFYN